MKRKIFLLIAMLVLISGYFIFKEMNRNGWIIPIKNSKSINHPNINGYQIITFRDFSLTLPRGWKDKGYIVGYEGEIRGELVKDGVIMVYEYGITAYPPTETLHDYLYIARDNSMIMGTEKIINQTDSTKEVTYVWPIDPKTSDTIKTGILNDSILNLYPKLNLRNLLLSDANYYSLTSYNDSVFFIPIRVPEVIIDSDISNVDTLGNFYNVVIPKKKKVGFTKVTCHTEGFFHVALWGENLDSINQQILLRAAFSVKFHN